MQNNSYELTCQNVLFSSRNSKRQVQVIKKKLKFAICHKRDSKSQYTMSTYMLLELMLWSSSREQAVAQRGVI